MHTLGLSATVISSSTEITNSFDPNLRFCTLGRRWQQVNSSLVKEVTAASVDQSIKSFNFTRTELGTMKTIDSTYTIVVIAEVWSKKFVPASESYIAFPSKDGKCYCQ